MSKPTISNTLSAKNPRKCLAEFRAGKPADLENDTLHPGTSIPDPIAEAINGLRGEQLKSAMKMIVERFYATGIWNPRKPILADLNRLCKQKRPLLARRSARPTAMAFEFTAFGALWQSDVLHGPTVLADGRKRKAYLLAIIDDASRFVVSARFHLNEGVESLMEDLRQTLICIGVPQRFYTDNGAAFRSQILHQVGARLGIAMPHTPPYQPQGRGKIERFFRTVRERFLAPTKARTLEQLNQDLHAWIAEYHKTPHAGINQETPLDKRLRIENLCRALPDGANVDALFMQDRLVRLYKDRTFRLQNLLFDAPQAKPGTCLHIFFRPWDLTTVFYGQEHMVAKPLDKHMNAGKFEHKNLKEKTHE